nr:transmembrane protein [Tanacetum cinerariifolium]
MVVIGDGVDAAALTSSVRKKVKNASLKMILPRLLQVFVDLYHFEARVVMGGDRLIAELEKLAVGAGAARYVQILRRKQDRDAVKLGLLKDLLRHVHSLGPSFAVVGLLPTDVSSRTCVAGDFMVSAAGSASSGFVRGRKTASKVKFGYLVWLAAQNGTERFPSLIIALKQYLFVDAMTLCSGKLALEIRTMLVYLLKVKVMSFGSVRSYAFVGVHRKREIPYASLSYSSSLNAMDVDVAESFTLDRLMDFTCLSRRSVELMPAMLLEFASTNGKFPLSVGMIFGSLASVIGLSRLINGMRGRKTFSDIRVLVMMCASMTLLRSCVTISRVPLQRPPDILRFQRSIIGALTLSSSLCGGKPSKFNEFRYSAGYNSFVSPPSFPCGTASSKLRPASAASESGIHNSGDSYSKFSGIWKRECAVLPDGNNNAAIPEVATVRTIFSSNRKALVIAFHRNVFPVVDEDGATVECEEGLESKPEEDKRIAVVSEASDVVFVPGDPEITWQIVVGTIAGITPFVVAGIEFSKRIVAQKKCTECGGSGLVLIEKEYIRCPNCGGFLPWQSWQRFFSG